MVVRAINIISEDLDHRAVGMKKVLGVWGDLDDGGVGMKKVRTFGIG